MMALVTAAREKAYPAEIALVLTNRPDAPGLAWASGQGIATAVVDHTKFPDRATFEKALLAEMMAHDIRLIALAGFMRVLTETFVDRWQGRMLNIHPSLLPEFRGLNTHARAIEAGRHRTGCTVHFVEPELDTGPSIVQAAVPILPSDTPESLSQRVLVQEHRIYPLALGWVASGKVRLSGGRIEVTGDLNADPDLVVPSETPPHTSLSILPEKYR